MRRLAASLAAPLALASCGDPSPVAPDAAAPMDVAADVTDAARDVAPDASPRYEGPARVTVTRYDHAIDLETRALTARLTLRVDAPGDCITLGFRHPMAEEVRFGDAPARQAKVANGTLLACVDGGLGPGATTVLTVRSTIPQTTLLPTQVGFSRRTNSAGRSFSYLLSWVGECGRVGPCDVAPSSFATYRFAVTHPAGTQVLCPGEVTPGDTETVCVLDRRGAPTYSSFGVLALAGGWRETDLGSAGTVRITLHDTPRSRVAESIDRVHLRSFVGWMAERFGPYPYGDALRFVTGPTYWSGFEHPGNIALAETLTEGGRLDHTVRHEVAHQWAGDQTTVAAVKDFVWKESMAEYLSYVFEDENGLPDQARASLDTWMLAASRADRYPVPDEDLALPAYYGNAYGPGPMILFRQLEVMFSRRQVVDAIRMVLGRERTLSVDELRMALEQTTGAQLDRYLRAWLRGTGAPAWPGVAVTRTPNPDGSLTVSVRVESRDAVVRPCRFRVRLTGDGGEALDVPFTVGLDGSAPAPATVRPTFPVTGAVVNPESEALVFEATTGSGARWIDHVPTPGYDPFRAP
ncbi:MAG: M1 family aminopeptidase [Polyangiales bacterium]